MKFITIELDQFRDRLDHPLAEVEQGGTLILTRQGKPWLVMQAVTRDRDAAILSEAGRDGETASASGPHGESVSIDGKTVSWVRKYLGEIFDVPAEAIALVDGIRVAEDSVLELGQVLAFTDLEGDEDWADELCKSPEYWETTGERRCAVAISWDAATSGLDLG